MCIVDNDDENAKTWGAWDKIPTYVDVYVPQHVAKNVARSSEAKTDFPVVPRCVFNAADIYGSEIVQNSTILVRYLTTSTLLTTRMVDPRSAGRGALTCGHDASSSARRPHMLARRSRQLLRTRSKCRVMVILPMNRS